MPLRSFASPSPSLDQRCRTTPLRHPAQPYHRNTGQNFTFTMRETSLHLRSAWIGNTNALPRFSLAVRDAALPLPCMTSPCPSTTAHHSTLPLRNNTEPRRRCALPGFAVASHSLAVQRRSITSPRYANASHRSTLPKHYVAPLCRSAAIRCRSCDRHCSAAARLYLTTPGRDSAELDLTHAKPDAASPYRCAATRCRGSPCRCESARHLAGATRCYADAVLHATLPMPYNTALRRCDAIPDLASARPNPTLPLLRNACELQRMNAGCCHFFSVIETTVKRPAPPDRH